MGGAVARVFRPTPPPAPAPIAVAPTAPEVSQSSAYNAADDARRALKNKQKGRAMTILSSPKGVEGETVTLGKKSLLGK